MEPIATISTDFPDKFGIPRQSGLIPSLMGHIVFLPKYRNPQALKGLDQFSHIWLLWKFSASHDRPWSATVKPPRLGGKKMGVFATRSPYRPNDIGLSCVKLVEIAQDPELGPVLYVSGADLMDGTPIYDIKPYVPLSDCHPEASEGFTQQTKSHVLTVDFPPHLLGLYPKEKQEAALGILAQDPRPAYVQDPDRIYGVSFAGYDIRFQVIDDYLTVCNMIPLL